MLNLVYDTPSPEEEAWPGIRSISVSYSFAGVLYCCTACSLPPPNPWQYAPYGVQRERAAIQLTSLVPRMSTVVHPYSSSTPQHAHLQRIHHTSRRGAVHTSYTPETRDASYRCSAAVIVVYFWSLSISRSSHKRVNCERVSCVCLCSWSRPSLPPSLPPERLCCLLLCDAATCRSRGPRS